MGFFEDLGSSIGGIFGLPNDQQRGGQTTIEEARKQAVGANLTGAQGAEQAGAAGQALGERMGRTAATAGSQMATQAARTAGVNKGQAALLGGQQAGQAFTQAQQAGQGLGMGAYDTAAQRQLQDIGLQANIGQAQQGAGRQQGQDFMGGISKVAGAAAMLGDGAIVTEPTNAVVGEKGPEAVIPLDDMDKVKAILKTVYASRKKGKKDATN